MRRPPDGKQSVASLRPCLAPTHRAAAAKRHCEMSSEFVRVGRVGRPHGLDGSFFVEEASEDPARFARGAILYVDGEPVQIADSKRSSGRPVVRLDRPVARGTALEVPRAELPPPGEDSFYIDELVGLEVVEERGARLGRVAAVEQGVANDVLELDTGLLLPFSENCVLAVQPEAGQIIVAEGFAEPD